ncbi:hypothetical protein JB92DRAFT_3103276 [Gautieria morchelliformis]|nr:hypothetical protein JB92DRAFT_3103276 [Gautieria morchelliformis]
MKGLATLWTYGNAGHRINGVRRGRTRYHTSKGFWIKIGIVLRSRHKIRNIKIYIPSIDAVGRLVAFWRAARLAAFWAFSNASDCARRRSARITAWHTSYLFHQSSLPYGYYNNNGRRNHGYFRLPSTFPADLNPVRNLGPSGLIAILVFPSITAVSAYLIRNALFFSGLTHGIDSQCEPGLPAYQRYGRICAQVLGFLAPVEGLLGSHPPTSTILTGGPIIPLYCLAFILTGAASAQNSDNAITAFAINRNHAEAIAFAVVVGYGVWRGARANTSQMDITLVKGLYAVTFVVTSIVHISTVLSSIHDLQVLKSFLFPPLSNFAPKATVSPTWVMEVFQWDGLLSVVAVMMVTLWFAKDAKELSRLLIWHVAATMTVGPSAGYLYKYYSILNLWKILFSKSFQGDGCVMLPYAPLFLLREASNS